MLQSTSYDVNRFSDKDVGYYLASWTSKRHIFFLTATPVTVSMLLTVATSGLLLVHIYRLVFGMFWNTVHFNINFL